VGGYKASDEEGKKVELPPLDKDKLTFYWWDSGDSRQVSYTYNASNGESKSATVTFNVTGPTAPTDSTVPFMTVVTRTDGSGVQVLDTPRLGTVLAKAGVLVANVPNVPGPVGIFFRSNATLPPGYNQSFTWVQIIDDIQINFITSDGPRSTLFPANSLDNFYPYLNYTDIVTVDVPFMGLDEAHGEVWETFTATMYLMWDPALTNDPSGCQPASTDPVTLESKSSTCTSIPIPLRSVKWHWSGCAINKLSSRFNRAADWLRSEANGCPKETLEAPQPADFPQWITRFENGPIDH
jgi:hypothetical protein